MLILKYQRLLKLNQYVVFQSERYLGSIESVAYRLGSARNRVLNQS